MIRDRNKEIVYITHCPLFCDILSHAKTRDEREEIYENNYYNLQLVSYELEKYRKLEEELGCPLKVLIKALKNGIYQSDGGRRKYPTIEYNEATKKFYFAFGTYCNVEDYKKAWFLREDKSE